MSGTVATRGAVFGRRASSRPRRLSTGVVASIAVATVVLLSSPAVMGSTSPRSVSLGAPYATGYAGFTTSSSNSVYPCAIVRNPVGPGFNFTSGNGHWQFNASARSCAPSGRGEADFSEGVNVELAAWSPTASGTFQASFNFSLDWILNATVIQGNSSAVATLDANWSLAPYVIAAYPYAVVTGPIFYRAFNFYLGNASSASTGSKALVYNISFSAVKGTVYVLGFSTSVKGQVEAFGAHGNRATFSLNVGTHGRHFGVPALSIH